MVITPSALGTIDAEYTDTPIAVTGMRHHVTGLPETLYFGTEFELIEYLRLGEGPSTTFDLNRSTGEWVAR